MISVTLDLKSKPFLHGVPVVILHKITSFVFCCEQGPLHPSPGQPYHANAFPRTCYLPNNSKGRKASIRKQAFVGRDATT